LISDSICVSRARVDRQVTMATRGHVITNRTAAASHLLYCTPNQHRQLELIKAFDQTNSSILYGD